MTPAAGDVAYGFGIADGIHHEGAVVWTIDTLRFGLQEENVFFADVVMLPPIPEP